MNTSTSDRNPLEQLAEEFAARLRKGEHPSLTEYIERFPELADDIRELFPALALVEQHKPVRNDHSQNAATGAEVPLGYRSVPEQLGDYRILRYLGEGGMGVVYEAVRESLRSHVALKVTHPQFRTREKYLHRFHTEARSAARLHHTNIVSVFDYGVHEGVCFYAMQYIAGQSLDKVLTDVRALRDEKAGIAPSETLNLPFTGARPSLEAALAGFADAFVETEALGRSIATGLLTGRYSTTGHPESTNEIVTPPITECQGGSEATASIDANGGLPTGEVALLGDRAPVDGHSSLVGSTSGLAAKSDDRYFREVARVAMQAADALAYAHNRGVLHRDIKPPNLVLDPLGNIWVTDFGLAKFEDSEDVSQSRDVVGTLRYMAPERFRGVSDRRCDIYALGATIYELLTLRPPFEGDDQLQLIRRIENEPPPAPRELDRRIPRDLETIVRKAMAKNPDDRFATANLMRDELRRYLENRPIRSRPIPFYQRFGRWCQRNPKLAAANIAAAVLTTMLAIVSTLAAWTYRDQRNEIGDNLLTIQASENKAREQLFNALVDRARAGRFSRRIGQRFDSLEALTQAAAVVRELKLPADRLDPLRDEAIACMALPDLKPAGRVIAYPPGSIAFAFDAHLNRYALRNHDGTIVVRQTHDDHEVARFHAKGDRDIWVFELSPDGRYLATIHPPDDALTVWDVDRRRVVLEVPFAANGYAAKFSPDGRRLATAPAEGVVLYDLATGQVSLKWPGPRARDLAFRDDGAWIAVLACEGAKANCRIFEVPTGRLVHSITLPHHMECVAVSSDGSTMATPCSNSKIYLWDVATGTLRATLEGSTGEGMRAAFHPAGGLLASWGWEERVRFWDAVLGRPVLSLSGFSIPRFTNDGRIAIAVADRLIPYRVDPALEHHRTLPHPAARPMGYGVPSIRHDGRLLAVGTDRGAAVWDLARGAELAFLPIGKGSWLMFEPSGDLLTRGTSGGQRWPVRLDLDRGELHIGPPRRLEFVPAGDFGIDEDRSGRIVAAAHQAHAHIQTPDRLFLVRPLTIAVTCPSAPTGNGWRREVIRAMSGSGGSRMVHRLPRYRPPAAAPPSLAPMADG